ncbi:MAG: hypothetical protein ABW250_18120 [Pyrinomonadaceae bacterium]
MPRTGGKKKGGARKRPADGEVVNKTRAGLPAPDSIVEVRQMERGGKTYRIIKTNERDEYDEPEEKGK